MSNGQILVAEHGGVQVMKFTGEVRVNLSAAMDQFIDELLAKPDFDSIVIDLTETCTIDSTSLGLLAKLAIGAQKRNGSRTTIVSTREDVSRVLETMGFEKIFSIVHSDPAQQVAPTELPQPPVEQDSESCARRRVIDAHKTLMSLSRKNRETFKDLVEMLEAS